jgi:integrase
MPTGKITKRSVDELAAGERETFLWDQELRGFGVKVTRKGAKSYVYQFRMGGREAPTRRHSIGKHGSPWTPSTARKEAERVAILVAQGVDPGAAEAERRRQNVDLAFEPYAERFLESCKGNGWRKLIERTLRLHVSPHFKRKSLGTIARSDVSEMLDHIPAHRVALRRNSFAVVRRLFRWAVSRGDIDRSPCDGMETPKAVAARDRALTFEELGRVWKASAAISGSFGPIVRLLIATGQRREEVSGLDWSELNQKDRLWTLPKERAKNAVSHKIPLNELASEVLTSQSGSENWPSGGLVFPTSGGKKFNAHSKGKATIDAVLAQDSLNPLATWRLHDLRRSLATGFQKLGVRFEVTEAVLNHLSGHKSGIAAVYQTHDWYDEKVAALTGWSDQLKRIFHSTATTSDEAFLAAHCCEQMASNLHDESLLEADPLQTGGSICEIDGIFGIVGVERFIEVSFCPWCGVELRRK